MRRDLIALNEELIVQADIQGAEFWYGVKCEHGCGIVATTPLEWARVSNNARNGESEAGACFVAEQPRRPVAECFEMLEEAVCLL